ncbi:flagellar type III secretion system pore protein FliP [Pseudoxanthobacter sp. M-2]|uniref:flagellar type III secretion system pore protein FliP n=1 Tax=Pseudoxanthobacter sp. M-2 TaxID=3078754 RepID=UPI0038FBF9F2
MTSAACTVPQQHRCAPGQWTLGVAALLTAALAFTATAGPAAAQDLAALADMLPEGGGSVSGRIIQFVALITVLSIAPGLLIMATSFTRLIVALSFLRSGLGVQSTPANLVLISLALFMTFFIMGPTFDRAWQDGVKPLTEGQITEAEAFERATAPFREFMLSQVRPKDLQLFADIASATQPQSASPASPAPSPVAEEVELRVLIPAFMISELRRGFEIGFLIALPFLVIDMIVATLVMSMGMMMMPPTVISLPFKILFFVLIDGWSMLVGSLVRSFG